MASQSRRDFFKPLEVTRATTASLPKTAQKADEKSKLPQDRICGFVDTAISNNCSF